MTTIKYTAHGWATHGGRTGEGRTDDGKVAVKLSVPKAMGGDDGPGTNPEQLFAIGYSACFLGSMASVVRKQGKKLPEGAEVHAHISFADRDDGVGATIIPVLTATIPGWNADDVAQLLRQTHDVCAYSNLIRFSHEVELRVGVSAA